MTLPNSLPAAAAPIARGPLVERHRRLGARIEPRDGWEIAVRYPHEPARSANRVVDLSHRPTFEVNGPDTSRLISTLCGTDLPVRHMHRAANWEAYRLTPGRAILFGRVPPPEGALDVTGGWASLALWGPQAGQILSKITAVDLRPRTLPAGRCCQGPIFGVNTLFGRFDDHFELHVCGDSAEFFWDVLFDAGAEFGLAPAGSV
jgi:glycine cleavage system aminomethyltransferase T